MTATPQAWRVLGSGRTASKAGSDRDRARCRPDRGAAAVEFALVLPMLLLLVFGLIDFGRLLNAQITVTEAAREGARAESLGVSVNTRVQAATSGLGPVRSGCPGTTSRPVCFTTDQACPAPLNPNVDAKVTVTYHFEFITPLGGVASLFGGGGFDDPIDVRSTGVMPCMQ